VAVALAACSAQAPVANAAAENSAQPTLSQVPLTIRSANGVHRFTVEVARTAAEQQMGLMYRRSLAPDRGMLFVFDRPQPLSFWMKNTYIPLDMLFIREDGRIAHIAASTTPLSLEPVGAPEPAIALLEIPGGRSAQLGIRAGDLVEWPR
jgi:uncharacterized protein